MTWLLPRPLQKCLTSRSTHHPGRTALPRRYISALHNCQGKRCSSCRLLAVRSLLSAGAARPLLYVNEHKANVPQQAGSGNAAGMAEVAAVSSSAAPEYLAPVSPVAASEPQPGMEQNTYPRAEAGMVLQQVAEQLAQPEHRAKEPGGGKVCLSLLELSHAEFTLALYQL